MAEPPVLLLGLVELLPLVEPPIEPLVVLVLEPLVVESVLDVPLPVLLVGAVVLVPVALPLVASLGWRLQADSISAALVAAMRAARRKVETERMALLLKVADEPRAALRVPVRRVCTIRRSQTRFSPAATRVA